jgi:hypothetical protein
MKNISSMTKHIRIGFAFGLIAAISTTVTAQEVVANQFYTYAEVFESAPLYGKSSLQCITCDDVLLGYKIALRMIQKGKGNDTEIVFETVVKTPVPVGTWVKVGVRADLVLPIKTN